MDTWLEKIIILSLEKLETYIQKVKENELDVIVKNALIGHFGNNNHQLNLQFELYSLFSLTISLSSNIHIQIKG